MGKGSGFLFGIVTGILGALVSARGAEFRFPIFVGPLRLQTLSAIQINLMVSLATTIMVCCVDQSGFFQSAYLAAKWRIYVNVLPGSLIGAFLGAFWISKRKDAKSWAISALIVAGLFVIVEQWLIIQRIHFHAGFVRSVITIVGALIGGLLTSSIGTGSEAIYIVTLAIFHDFGPPMGEVIASSTMIPTVLVSLATYWSCGQLSLPKGSTWLATTMAVGSAMGVLLVNRIPLLNGDWLLHGILGLLLILVAMQTAKRMADRNKPLRR